jgi:hypothetical protein
MAHHYEPRGIDILEYFLFGSGFWVLQRKFFS